MKHTLLFATIASFVAVHAYASNIVASKTYVDNRDALKVDIAQGTGDNNANVGKTLVVNSSGNLELGTPAAANYVEDAITNDVTNKAPSENAVHDALADKQDTIETDTVTFTDVEDQEVDYEVPSLVAFDSTHGINGTQIGLVDLENGGGGLTFLARDINPEDSVNAVYDNYVPTFRTVAAGLEDIWNYMPERLHWSSLLQNPINNYSTTFSSASDTWPNDQQSFVPSAQTFANGLALKQNRQIGAAPVGNANSTDAGKVLVVDNNGEIDMGTVPDNVPTNSSTNLVTSGGVYTAISGKQDAIETDTVTFTEAEEEVDYEVPSLVAFDSTHGINGTQIGLVDLENGGAGLTFLAYEMSPWDSSNAVYDNYVPTYRTVAAGLSNIYDNIDDLWANIPDITPITWVSKDTTAVNSYSTTFGSGRSDWPAEHENQYVTGASLAQGLALKQKILPAVNPITNPNGLLVTYGTTAGQPGSKKIVTTVASGGTNIPTDGAVYTAVNAKQDKIPARETKINDTDSTYAPSVVTNGTTDGDVGQMAILTAERVSNDDAEFADYTNADSLIPTVAAVASAIGDKQDEITTAEVNYHGYMLPSIVSFDSTNGLTGDIYGILDDGTIASNTGQNVGAASFVVSTLNALNMIPTAAAVARAIMPINFNSAAVTNYSTTFDGTVGNWQSNGENLLVSASTFVGGLALKQNRQIGASPVGNANSTDAGKVLVVGNDGNIAMGSAPDSAPTNSSTNLVTSGGVYTAVNAKQTKKTCAGWLDGTTTPDATHTDANCVLWNLPD